MEMRLHRGKTLFTLKMSDFSSKTTVKHFESNPLKL